MGESGKVWYVRMVGAERVWMQILIKRERESGILNRVW